MLGASVLSFGVTVLPDPPASRLVELFRLAEQNGFEYGWTYDSHILWQEPYPLLTVCALNTSKLKLGLNVTNPGTREPTVTASAFATLQDISGGRMVMGIGRGDSARRVIGQQPVKVAEFEQAVAMIGDLMNGREVRWFPAMVSNHVFDLLSKYDKSSLPASLTDYVERMHREQYDYSEHSRVGASHGAEVTDETCERFCILGTPEQHVAKLKQLESAGVDQWNIYLMTSGQEHTLETYGKEIIPALAG